MATVLESVQNVAAGKAERLIDKHGRAITDLRISVTDRCNYKCVYCRTGNEGAVYAELLIADYLRMARVFVGLGIEKVRLTGGEPLLRRGLTDLIRELGKLRTLDGGALDLALTTNGHLLEEMAERLRDAGLSRITVSMDAVDAEKFVRITRVPGSYERVLRGVRAAKAAGLAPVKVNCVLLRGFNEDQIVEFARFSREEGVIVRFIEFMPLEEGRLWTLASVVSMKEIVEALGTFRPVVRMAPNAASETAVRYTFDDGVGEIGIIAPVTQSDHDLYGVMQRGGSDEDLEQFIRRTVEQKEARHHIGEPGFLKPSRSMVHIGG